MGIKSKKKKKKGGSSSGEKSITPRILLLKTATLSPLMAKYDTIHDKSLKPSLLHPLESLAEDLDTLFKPICSSSQNLPLVEDVNEEEASESGDEEVNAIDEGSAVGKGDNASNKLLETLRNTMSRDVASIGVRKTGEPQSNMIDQSNGVVHQSQAKVLEHSSTSKTPWRDLFGDNRKKGRNLKFHESPDEEVVVEATQEAIDEVKTLWGHVLIGYVAGTNPGNGAVIGCCKSWRVKYQIYFDPSGWVVIKFENEGDRDKVLDEGPYVIYGRPFILKIMPPLFSFDDRELAKVPIWVKLPHLPLELVKGKGKEALVENSSKEGTTSEMPTNGTSTSGKATKWVRKGAINVMAKPTKEGTTLATLVADPTKEGTTVPTPTHSAIKASPKQQQAAQVNAIAAPIGSIIEDAPLALCAASTSAPICTVNNEVPLAQANQGKATANQVT